MLFLLEEETMFTKETILFSIFLLFLIISSSCQTSTPYCTKALHFQTAETLKRKPNMMKLPGYVRLMGNVSNGLPVKTHPNPNASAFNEALVGMGLRDDIDVNFAYAYDTYETQLFKLSTKYAFEKYFSVLPGIYYGTNTNSKHNGLDFKAESYSIEGPILGTARLGNVFAFTGGITPAIDIISFDELAYIEEDIYYIDDRGTDVLLRIGLNLGISIDLGPVFLRSELAVFLKTLENTNANIIGGIALGLEI